MNGYEKQSCLTAVGSLIGVIQRNQSNRLLFVISLPLLSSLLIIPVFGKSVVNTNATYSNCILRTVVNYDFSLALNIDRRVAQARTRTLL